jgi:hypothetical protein
VQVIGHRNGKKQQDQGYTDGGPLLERMPASALTLADPARAPKADDARRDQQPDDIEE